MDSVAKLCRLPLSACGLGLLLLSSAFAQGASAPAGKAPPKLVVFMVVDGFPQEQLLNNPVAYTPSAKEYADWLQCGLDAHKKTAKK